VGSGDRKDPRIVAHGISFETLAGRSEASGSAALAGAGQRYRGRRWEPALALVALLFGLAEPAWARDCGGRRVCRCGDRVVSDYELVADLGPCEKHGLILDGPVTLDGGGHKIRGSRARSSAGVVLKEKAGGSRVRNLEVTGFERGVRLAGVQRAHVENVESHHNGDPVAHKGYGIDVSKSASDNVIENVHVHHNADEGIHIGNGSRGNRVVKSRVEENYREQVYFLENEDNSLEGSTIRGGGASAVFVKHARNVRIEGNTIDGRGIQVRGSSSDIRIAGNTLEGMGVVVQPYRKKGSMEPMAVPSGVTVEKGRIRAESACVRLVQARGTKLESAELACPTSLTIDGDSDVQAIDTKLEDVRCEGDGSVTRMRRADAKFVDAKGNAVGGVQVRSRGGTTLAQANAKGVLDALVPLGQMVCPDTKWSRSSDVKLSSGEWSREIAAADLKGTIRVDAGE